MIVVAISVFGLIVWSVLLWKGLRHLRRERLQAKRTWQGDLYETVRNKRAVALFALWSLVLSYTLTTAQYVDSSWIDFSRVVGVTERILLLVCGLWIFFGPGEKVV